MRAVRYHGQKDIRVEDIDAPEAGKGEVLIDIAWCGICGTDLHEYLEGPIFVPKPGHPHPITGEEPPVTLGHEFSGVVSALGEGVEVHHLLNGGKRGTEGVDSRVRLRLHAGQV